MSISSVRAQEFHAQGSPKSRPISSPPVLPPSGEAARLDLTARPIVEWVALMSRVLARAARSRGLVVDPDDLAQETWLRLYSRRGGLPGFVNEAAARAYLAQTAANIVASKRRASRTERRGAAVVEYTDVEIEAPTDTERDLLMRERVRVLARSLSRATANAVRGRNATMLRALWLEGLSAVEVAERFGMSKSTVNTIVFRARRVLASAAARHDDVVPPPRRMSVDRPRSAHLQECGDDGRVLAP
jgi:RNA polymerase sigma factor (sigma-70 family)